MYSTYIFYTVFKFYQVNLVVRKISLWTVILRKNVTDEKLHIFMNCIELLFLNYHYFTVQKRN